MFSLRASLYCKPAGCTSRRGIVICAVQTPLKIEQKDAAVQEKKVSKCPFAQAATFFAEAKQAPAGGARVTPLTQAGGAEQANPHLWMEAGVPGQDKPNRLVTGLRQLTDLDEFLIQIPEEMVEELELKKRAFEDPVKREQCFAAEQTDACVEAQAECLEMFLEYLPKRYPELYIVEGEGDNRMITVRPTGDTYCVVDYASRPLELCCRIAQEDLVLMRDEPALERYVMSAAAVVFSFGGLHEKVGAPVALIHAPVPGFATDIDKLVAKTFNALRPEAPVWRNNWGTADSGQLDNPLYGTEEAFHARSTPLPPQERWLKTEYQTLRRLPKTKQVLFTVRTFVEPMPKLAETPEAAAVIAASLAGMSPALRTYKGLATEAACQEMLEYLKNLAAPGKVNVSHLQLLKP